jgi:hypothetical protein
LYEKRISSHSVISHKINSLLTLVLVSFWKCRRPSYISCHKLVLYEYFKYSKQNTKETDFHLSCLQNCLHGDMDHDIVGFAWADLVTCSVMEVLYIAGGCNWDRAGETCTSDIQTPVSGVTLTKYTQNHSD